MSVSRFFLIVSCVALVGCGEDTETPAADPVEPVNNDPNNAPEPEPVPEPDPQPDPDPASDVDDGSVPQADPQCGTFEACGGDYEGTWQWAGWCQKLNNGSPECPDGSSTSSLEPEGTMILNEDGTYELAATILRTDEVILVEGCLSGRLCDELAERLDGEPEQWACGQDVQDDLPVCVCHREQTLEDNHTGVWSEVDGKLHLVEDGEEEVREIAFCVDGEEMTLLEMNGEELILYDFTR